MPELEDQLTVLTASIEWPPTPQLRKVWTDRLFEEPAPRIVRTISRSRLAIPALVRTNRRFVLATAAALLIVITVAFTWLSLHATIYRVQNPPTPSALPSGKLGSNLDLGTPTTLSEAQAKVSWKIVVPPSLGQPDAVYLKLAASGGPSAGEVSLVYTRAPGVKTSAQTGVAVLVTEARGAVNENFFVKIIGPDTQIEQVSVNGHPGFWVAGHPHDFAFSDANGNFYMEHMRLATNTLVFDDNGTIVRIEGDMTKAQALKLASSL